MPSRGTAVVTEGKVELPEEVLRSQHWIEGSRVKVIETPEGVLLMGVEPSRHRRSQVTFEQLLEANRQRLGLSVDDDSWRALEGILADDLLDSVEEKHRLRDEELEHDRRQLQG